jgi:signal transduction histidine kinase
MLITAATEELKGAGAWQPENYRPRVSGTVDLRQSGQRDQVFGHWSARPFEIGFFGEEIICAIRDQGIGIPKADREWLFTAFHRGQNVADRAGTGLGLAIVKRSLDLHGGKFKVESECEKGTTVTVRLPMARKVSPPAGAPGYWA